MSRVPIKGDTSASTNEEYDILLIQDRLTAPGGGERVAYHIWKEFDCDIVTGAFEPESTYEFDPLDVTELGGNTFNEFMKARNSIEWNSYDVAIFSGNRPQFSLWRKINIPTIRYCHSPARVFWSLRDVAYRDSSMIGKLARHAVAPMYRNLDRWLAGRHDHILTNSHNIRSQVDRFYGLDADVLHPPVDTDDYWFKESGDFWLTVSRLVPKKRIREQIEAFEGTDERLHIVGGVDEQFQEYGEYVTERAKTAENVKISGFIPDEDLRELYACCKGVIYFPFYEDFGIVPIEAMASGKPVIAAAEGGPLETITNDTTGWLIKPSSDKLQSVITRQFDIESYRRACQVRARSFDVDQFCSELETHLGNALQTK
ncbi:glycosyltransferase [Haloarcula sediminis]|uniref:glycosyltransferase n=1 Tax=Haloarcula sediminis TaxID=3111777 RepID=UPI002D787898|nr:glycosyltransferase [Haloarcula sp. CK38]